MKLAIVTPSRGREQNIGGLIKSLDAQTFQDFVCYILIDKTLTQSELDQYDSMLNSIKNRGKIIFVTHLTHDFKPGNGVSYVRNYGMSLTDSEFLYLIDDDNMFDSTFLESSLRYREDYRNLAKKDIVLVPTIMDKDTGNILNQGFLHFNYLLSRPKVNFLGSKQFANIQMYGGNSLLAPSFIFKRIRFDERIDYVYEDLDFSYRIFLAGVPIIVVNDLRIKHMEKPKTRLDHAFVGDISDAYRKSKHRILLVRKNGDILQKFIFFTVGVWLQTFRLIGKILLYSPKGKKATLIRAVIKGMMDGVGEYI